MNIVDIQVSKQYQVIIGADILDSVGDRVCSVCQPEKAVIVSDSNVFPLYGSTVQSSLEQAGIQTASFIFPAGEESKSGNTYLELLSFLASSRMSRSDCLIALGGGVTGDMTGFAAATYLRGIAYVQIPTTLLAAVDSSVGGKTAIDLPAGKNLVGAFYHPKLVLCDISTLDTLPEDVFLDGCAEVIKYGILYDKDLFAHLETCGPDFNREAVITRCVELKRDVVTQDEFDTGARMKLNLGHTIGHSIEAQSQYSISHGKGVAIGTAVITRAGYAGGYCSEEVCERILGILTRFGLPVSTGFTPEELFYIALSDKKRSGGTVNLIIPTDIGSCDIIPTEISALQSFIKAGM